MATLAPSAARRLAIAAPIPRDPPVTSAIFPSSFFVILLLFPGFWERALSSERPGTMPYRQDLHDLVPRPGGRSGSHTFYLRYLISPSARGKDFFSWTT